MYCLPRKKLYITGKAGLTVTVPQDEVAEVIEAGRPPAGGNRYYDARYDKHSAKALLKLLGSWSPTVRTHAAKSLAKKARPQQHIPALLKMLDSDNRFAGYGACMALRHMKAGSDEVVVK